MTNSISQSSVSGFVRFEQYIISTFLRDCHGEIQHSNPSSEPTFPHTQTFQLYYASFKCVLYSMLCIREINSNVIQHYPRKVTIMPRTIVSESLSIYTCMFLKYMHLYIP